MKKLLGLVIAGLLGFTLSPTGFSQSTHTETKTETKTEKKTKKSGHKHKSKTKKETKVEQEKK